MYRDLTPEQKRKLTAKIFKNPAGDYSVVIDKEILAKSWLGLVQECQWKTSDFFDGLFRKTIVEILDFIQKVFKENENSFEHMVIEWIEK